jgi:hypothetical protein
MLCGRFLVNESPRIEVGRRDLKSEDGRDTQQASAKGLDFNMDSQKPRLEEDWGP